MRRKLLAKALIIPLLTAFLLLAPLVGAAVVGEHRYAHAHPAYGQRLLAKILGEEDVLGECQEEDDFSALDGTTLDPISTGKTGGRINILVIGRDQIAGLTDVMMLLSLNPTDHSVGLLQIPRDTYAAYTRNSYRKINGAYARLQGDGLTAFVRDNMAIPVDHYVCVNLSVLGEMVNAIGGVRLTIPQDMDYDDPEQGLHIHLKAGEQVLDGDTAKMFVRFRSGYAMADVGRMDAQKLFLSALARQVKENLTIPQMITLIGQCFGKVKTNMSLRECIGCIKEMWKVDLSSLHMTTLPGGTARMQGKSGAWYYILNREATVALLERDVGLTGEFDPGRVFEGTGKPSFETIYQAPASAYTAHSYTAQEALDGDIHIKRIS